VSTKLFVGSLPWSLDDQALQTKFEEHGTVVSAKIINDRDTGRSRGAIPEDPGDLVLSKWKVPKKQVVL